MGSAIVILVTCLAVEITAQGSATELLQKARQAASQGDSTRAVELASQVIDRDPSMVLAYHLRGREHFRLGKISESIADFDKCLELQPETKSQLWERGISLYYGGQFERGAEQFVFTHMYHENDVENSLWRYLCMARSVGAKKARAAMLPVTHDSRVPMMQIYNLYRGKSQPEEVLKAAKAVAPTKAALNLQLFHAHLYLGLYYDSLGQRELARKHISQATNEYDVSPYYLADVARLHDALLQKE